VVELGVRVTGEGVEEEELLLHKEPPAAAWCWWVEGLVVEVGEKAGEVVNVTPAVVRGEEDTESLKVW